jgi:hypothetical protein
VKRVFVVMMDDTYDTYADRVYANLMEAENYISSKALEDDCVPMWIEDVAFYD